ncbi:hypothetical protein K501DRAFT_301317 [Backusella circina FSU 941]|nr:hypothetical protein K501DRAFT_301317 [Backusella circina FSU 941]
MDEDQGLSRIFVCPQCPKIFATRSNLKRHMENPNIHNIPYVRSRDQKRWKGHSKKIVSKEETTESNNDRMRKWRAENREKNRQNDLRCRVYRLARQKFGDPDTLEKQAFVRDEISRRLDKRLMMERREANGWTTPIRMQNGIQLPFYSVPQQKIELPSLDTFTRPIWSSPSESSITELSPESTSPLLPQLSPTLCSKRRTSSSSISSLSSFTSEGKPQDPENQRRSCARGSYQDELCVLPSVHTFLSYASPVDKEQTTSCMPAITTKGGIKYVESNKILDEFVGVVLNYANHNATQ